jgi:microsomal epoxide hydrolase/non-specific protein-tyrosine kinase
MTFPIRQYTALKNIKIATYQAGPEDGLPILLVHGWPEIAYSWKNQIGPLSDAGYRVIAMDVRGFGYSDAPPAKEEYGIEKLVGDIEGVFDHLCIKQAVICGHDWGGIIVWHAARLLRERVMGVISVCTPHVKISPVDPMAIFEKRYGKDHYFVEYKNSTRADELFASDPAAFFRLMFRTTPKSAKPSAEMYHIVKRFAAYLEAGAPSLKGAIMSDQDMQVYVDAYKNSGFHGGHNLYRNTTENWRFGQTITPTIEQPSLMISAAQDLFLPPAATNPMVDMVADLERHTIEDCGHWTMWEKPDELNALILDWLSRRMAG